MGKGIPLESHQVTIADLAIDVLRDYEMNGYKTIDDQRHRFDEFILPFFAHGRMKAVDINAGHITEFKVKRKAEGATNGEVNRELSAIKRAFNLGIQNERIFRKPYIEMLPELRKRTEFWRDKEFAILLKYWESVWTRPMLEFMNLTGWRLGEVQPLRWTLTVDWENRRLRIPEGITKSKEPRFFPFYSCARKTPDRSAEDDGSDPARKGYDHSLDLPSKRKRDPLLQ